MNSVWLQCEQMWLAHFGGTGKIIVLDCLNPLVCNHCVCEALSYQIELFPRLHVSSQTWCREKACVLMIWYWTPVADRHSKILDAPGSKFFQFHAVFGKIWQNRMLAHLPPEGWRLHLGEILDPPLNTIWKSFPAFLLNKHMNTTKINQTLF